MSELCAEHAWASIGVTVVDGTVSRVWACENCPAWTRQPLEATTAVDWADTWLAERRTDST